MNNALRKLADILPERGYTVIKYNQECKLEVIDTVTGSSCFVDKDLSVSGSNSELTGNVLDDISFMLDENLGLVHSECATKRHTEWQEKNKNTAISAGDFVKLGFTHQEELHLKHCRKYQKEWMWVQVTQVNDEIPAVYTGRLANDPVKAKLKCGEEVIFMFTDIAAHVKDEKFDF